MGIVFYEILVGKVPFDGNNPEEIAIKQIKNHLPEPSLALSSVPRALDKIIIKACRKRKEERFQSSKEMHDAILEAMKNGKKFKERKGFFSWLFGFK